MSRIIGGRELVAELAVRCSIATQPRFAVAFWGDGAIERLALRERAGTAEIVCNLRMGGTNPRVIRDLIGLGARIRHADVLHAKLYLLDDWAAVGSSNVSANGLSCQDDEAAGWLEANVALTDPEDLQEAAIFFARAWEGAREVTETDLAKAQDSWDRRRRAGAPTEAIAAPTLLDALRGSHALLRDRSLYLKVDFAAMSEAGEAEIAAERQETGAGSELSGWEDWPDMPDGATFACFYRGPRGGLTPDGFWHAPERRRARKSSIGTTVNLVEWVEDLRGIRSIGPLSDWRALITRAMEDVGEDDVMCIELGELARRYL